MYQYAHLSTQRVVKRIGVKGYLLYRLAVPKCCLMFASVSNAILKLTRQPLNFTFSCGKYYHPSVARIDVNTSVFCARPSISSQPFIHTGLKGALYSKFLLSVHFVVFSIFRFPQLLAFISFLFDENRTFHSNVMIVWSELCLTNKHNFLCFLLFFKQLYLLCFLLFFKLRYLRQWQNKLICSIQSLLFTEIWCL